MLRAALLAFALTLSAVPVAADTIDDAIAAHNRGDYETAERLFRPLAEQGDAVAQYNLGDLYHNGQGVPQDYAEAVRWYRMAAEQGYAWAQNNLGVMYKNGNGVPQDDVLAYMWLNLAVAQGNDDAKNNRDALAKRMTSEQIAEAQRLAREWKPKE
jgi:TPR repeat protein